MSSGYLVEAAQWRYRYYYNFRITVLLLISLLLLFGRVRVLHYLFICYILTAVRLQNNFVFIYNIIIRR